MISDLDIYHSGNALLREHGENATIEATQHADAMLKRGDLDGFAVWTRILAAIEEIRRTEPAEGEAIH